MSRKQSRRSISVSGETYDRLQTHVQANGTTGSGFVEKLLREFFEMDARSQKEAIAPLPKFERKPRATKEVTIVSPVLEKNGDWVEKGPADRVQVIRDMTEAKAAFAKKEEDPPKKKEGVLPGDMASKIFTF